MYRSAKMRFGTSNLFKRAQTFNTELGLSDESFSGLSNLQIVHWTLK